MEDVPLRDALLRDGVDAQLLAQVRELSLRCFGVDAVDEYGGVGKGGRISWLWADRAALRRSADDASTSATSWNSESEEPVLLGFTINKYVQPSRQVSADGYIQPKRQTVPGGQVLTIIYAAVAEEFRGRGIGKHLVKAVVKFGKNRKDVGFVTLSALPTAIGFYERLGFEGFEGALSQQESAIPGQLYMEYKTLKSRKRR